jgi:hypothetical protein
MEGTPRRVLRTYHVQQRQVRVLLASSWCSTGSDRRRPSLVLVISLILVRTLADFAFLLGTVWAPPRCSGRSSPAFWSPRR